LTLKKQHLVEGEIAIFDKACIYKRGDYWPFRMWLPKEHNYATKSRRALSEAYTLKGFQGLCKVFGFTAVIATGSLAKGRRAND
jgi:hypothetical protein